MTYKPFTLEVNDCTVTFTTAGETVSRKYRDANTAAQRFGDVLQFAKEQQIGRMG
jgi:hypothetical protein